MLAIMRREFKAYFTSPIGYIVVAAFYLMSGIFYSQLVAYGYADMRNLFGSMYTVIMFLIPVLTMRLMSEDKKIKTDQILLTSPVTITGIVLGKYFAALLVYLIATLATVVQCVVVCRSRVGRALHQLYRNAAAGRDLHRDRNVHLLAD